MGLKLHHTQGYLLTLILSLALAPLHAYSCAQEVIEPSHQAVRVSENQYLPYTTWRARKAASISAQRSSQTPAQRLAVTKHKTDYLRKHGRPSKKLSDYRDLVHHKHRSRNAKTIVLVHGMGVSSRGLLDLAEGLKNRFNVVMYTRSGISSTTDYAFEVDHLMKQLGYDSYSVMGHSYGGKIALRLAHLFPERVESAIFHDAVFSGDRPQNSAFQTDYISENVQHLFSATRVPLLSIRRHSLFRSQTPSGKTMYLFDKTHTYPVIEMDINQHFMHEHSMVQFLSNLYKLID